MADFVWPASPHGRVSSKFGKRKSPGGVGSTDHKGIDIAGCTYILAARAGTVSLGGYNKYRGYFLKINHGGGVVTLYQHIKQNGYLVGNGQTVTAGQRIGLVGSTGAATGPHLHFEVQIKGAPVNPLGYTYGTSAGTGALAGTGTGAVASTPDSQKAAAVVHVPQTEKVYTAYEGDVRGKCPVGEYRITWQSLATGRIRDITDRCSAPEMADDADSLCLELSFAVMQGGDYYMPALRLEPGDFVTLTNTGSGEAVFLGQVQTVSGAYSGSMQIRCLDGGRLLTCNEIVMQFSNIAAKAALGQIAAKLGLPAIVCPELVSSVYGIYKDSASAMAKSILDTITSENGVRYFLRMVGTTLTVRSFGKDPVTLLHKQASNLDCFCVLDEPWDVQISRDITDLRNRVTAYGNSDSSVSVLASAEDAESIKKYGLRQAVETISDSGKAQARANTLLKEKNRVAEVLQVTCYGSDRAVAGALVHVALAEAEGNYWITAARHTYGTPHTMTLTLQRAEVSP